MSENRQAQLTMRDVFLALWRYKWRAGSFFCFCMVAAILYTMLSPRTYESTGKLFVRVGRENATLDPAATLGERPVVTVPNSRENEINTVAEMLSSQSIVEHVVDKLGPDVVLGAREPAQDPVETPDTAVDEVVIEARGHVAGWVDGAKQWVKQLSPNPPAPLTARDEAIMAVADGLQVEPLRKSNVVSVTYQSKSPMLSRAVVAEVVEFYVAEHARLNRPEGAHEFFAQQKAEVLEKLRQAENELRELQGKTGPASRDGQRDVVVARIARLEDDLTETESTIAVSEAKVQSLRRKLAEAPDTEVSEEMSGIGDSGTNSIRSQFYALQLQEQEAAAKYETSHPKLQQIREQLASARRALEAEPPTRSHVTVTPGRVDQEAKLALLTEEPLLASMTAKRDTLRTQLASARQQWDALNENDIRLAKLQRDVSQYDSDYRKYASNFEQTRIDEALRSEHISNINVLQEATYNAKPVRPNKMLNLALGLLAGAFGGLSLALLADNRDRPFMTPEEVETNLELPTLVAIPRLKRKQLVLNGRN